MIFTSKNNDLRRKQSNHKIDHSTKTGFYLVFIYRTDRRGRGGVTHARWA